MATQFSTTRGSVLLLGLWLASCDPVRPGDYQGNYPSSVTLDLSLISNPTTQVGAEVVSFYLQDGRVWGPGGGDEGVLRPAGRSRIEPSLWPGLVRGMSLLNHGDIVYSPVVGFGIVRLWAYAIPEKPNYLTHGEVPIGQLAVGANHLLVVSDTDLNVQPVGPAGPTVPIKAGFQILHRTCSPENPNQFETVPLDAAIEMVPSTEWGANAPDAAYLTTCGVNLATPDLGQHVPYEPDGDQQVPPELNGLRGSMQSMVWSPSGDRLYFLTGWPGLKALGYSQPSILGSVDGTSLAITTLTSDGCYAGPLQVASNGTSLLLNQLVQSSSPAPPYQTLIEEPMRISLQPGTPIFANLPFNSLGGVLSPDGNTLAYMGVLLDLATGRERVLDRNRQILAWAPDGNAVLAGDIGLTGPYRTGRLLPPDGSSPGATLEGLRTNLSWDVSDPCPSVPYYYPTSRPIDTKDRNRHYFWTASGPKVVTQDCRGVLVKDVATQQIITFVEPDRAAVVAAPLQAVAATDQIFAWAIQCFGVGETSCNAELRRLSFTTGARDVVATANNALVFAVSPDGKKLALALDSRKEKYNPEVSNTDIYVKSLVP
jgi:hypothetical protein